MKLGACICAYNGAKYLAEAMDSILAQDRRPDEVLLVNDGSTDGTSEVMERYSGEPGVRILHHDQNLGQGEGFNTVIRNATAEVMCFLDADDYWNPEKTTVVESMFLKHPDVAVVQHNMEVLEFRTPTGRPYAEYMYTGDLYKMWVEGRAVAQLIPTSGLSIRMETLRNILPIPAVRHSADSYMARASILHGRVYTIPENLGGYRVHDENVFHGNENHNAWNYFLTHIAPPLTEHYRKCGAELPDTLKPPRRKTLSGHILDLNLRKVYKWIKRSL